jgi:hypothetical protein
LLGKCKGDSAQEVGEKVFCKNDNSKGTYIKRKEAGTKVHVQVYKTFETKGYDLK